MKKKLVDEIPFWGFFGFLLTNISTIPHNYRNIQSIGGEYVGGDPTIGTKESTIDREKGGRGKVCLSFCLDVTHDCSLLCPRIDRVCTLKMVDSDDHSPSDWTGVSTTVYLYASGR